MYIITLTTETELSKNELDDVIDLLYATVDLKTLFAIDHDGGQLEVSALYSQHDDGYEYEFESMEKIDCETGNMIVSALTDMLEGDFEFNAPLDEDSCDEEDLKESEMRVNELFEDDDDKMKMLNKMLRHQEKKIEREREYERKRKERQERERPDREAREKLYSEASNKLKSIIMPLVNKTDDLDEYLAMAKQEVDKQLSDKEKAILSKTMIAHLETAFKLNNDEQKRLSSEYWTKTYPEEREERSRRSGGYTGD